MYISPYKNKNTYLICPIISQLINFSYNNCIPKFKRLKMIREVIRPQQTNLTIDIPSSYIDKEVELIIFPLDEREILSKTEHFDIESLGGTLNKYANPSKIEIENKAWEMHVMDKYS